MDCADFRFRTEGDEMEKNSPQSGSMDDTKFEPLKLLRDVSNQVIVF